MNSTNAPDNQSPTGERLHYLKKYIGGQVKDTVESHFLLPHEDAFEERYEKPFVIADGFRDKLENWQHINPRDGTALQRYADFLRQSNIAIKSIGNLRVLNDEHAVGSTEKYLERKTATTTMVQERTIKGSHQELMFLAVTDIVNQLIQAHIQKKDVNLNSIKGKSASKYGLARQPRLVDIIAAVPQQYKRALVPKLKSKSVRKASGIAVVAVMCKPHRCPHIAMTGNICVYCPGGPDSDFEYSTQSYTGYEPTSMRAIRARYNPYLQTRHRVEQLKQLGHSVDKVKFIVMSGTFMILSEEYREFFIRNLHDALSRQTSSSVAKAVKYSEKSWTKCIGITIETRPDYCLRKHLGDMLYYGCTRLEIGYNCTKAFTPWDIIAPTGNGPYRQRTDLGWGIVGNAETAWNDMDRDNVGISHHIVVKDTAKDLTLARNVGPDFINSLCGVLCRFFKEPVDFVCDIEQMFLQFRLETLGFCGGKMAPWTASHAHNAWQDTCLVQCRLLAVQILYLGRLQRREKLTLGWMVATGMTGI